MNMDEIKVEAEIAADQIDINWKALENPEYRKDFEGTLGKAVKFIPELELLWAIVAPEDGGVEHREPAEDTPLGFEDAEKYSDLIAEELFNGYVLRSVYRKYTAIENIIAASLDNPAPDQLDFFDGK